MTDIEKALSREYKIGEIMVELQTWQDALVTLADAYRAEKERADKAEAALELIKPVITWYTSDEWEALPDE